MNKCQHKTKSINITYIFLEIYSNALIIGIYLYIPSPYNEKISTSLSQKRNIKSLCIGNWIGALYKYADCEKPKNLIYTQPMIF